MILAGTIEVALVQQEMYNKSYHVYEKSLFANRLDMRDGMRAGQLAVGQGVVALGLVGPVEGDAQRPVRGGAAGTLPRHHRPVGDAQQRRTHIGGVTGSYERENRGRPSTHASFAFQRTSRNLFIYLKERKLKYISMAEAQNLICLFQI